MKVGSVFSGIGAPEVAWASLGWTFAWCAEIDPFASAVLAHRFPHVPNLGDVTKVDWTQVEKVDMLVGGPPCQTWSIAGNRAGLADARGDLTLTWAEIIDAVDPLWSLTENVPGWLNHPDNGFGQFLARLVGAELYQKPL